MLLKYPHDQSQTPPVTPEGSSFGARSESMKAPKKATLEGRHTPAAKIVKHQTTGRQQLIAANVKAPPLTHSIIVGDVLYNLRSLFAVGYRQ